MDGRGYIRVAATRSPDLLRRQISSETGSARLLWCAVPPPDIAVTRILADLDRLLWRQRVEQDLYDANAKLVVRHAKRIVGMNQPATKLLRKLLRPVNFLAASAGVSLVVR